MPIETKASIDQIVAHKRESIEARKRVVPLAAVRAQARMQDERNRPQDMVSILRNGKLSLIAQVKQATPSRGRLIHQYDPVSLARHFERSGAAALAVSTESQYHKGGLDHLMVIKEAVQVPVWGHDYIIDPYQVYQTRAAGADGLMITPSLLDDAELLNIISLTQRLRMTALVQVRSRADVERARLLEPRVVGVVCRNPATHEIDLNLPARISPLFPKHTTIIAMGGIRTIRDVKRVANAGIDGILVGEALLTAGDSAAKIHELISVPARLSDFRRPWSRD